MENIDGAPDAAHAREALAGGHAAQRALRAAPWPTWLHLVNAVLLGLLAATSSLQEFRSSASLAVSVLVIAVNTTARYRMGTPWVLPGSRGFLLRSSRRASASWPRWP